MWIGKKGPESCGFGVQYSVNWFLKDIENLEMTFKDKQGKQTQLHFFLSFSSKVSFIFSKFRQLLDFAILFFTHLSLRWNSVFSLRLFFFPRDLHKLKVSKQPLCQPSALAHICQAECSLKFRLWT